MRFTQLATCVAVGILCLNSCLNKQKGYTIHGNVNGFAEGETIFLRSCDENMYVDSCKVTNGEFTLKGEVEFPKKFFLHSRLGQGKVALTTMYVENAQFQITGDFEKFRICNIQGGKAQQIENTFLSQVKEMLYENDTLDQYLRKNWNTIPEETREKLRAKLWDNHHKIKKTELEFLRENYNSVPGLERLAMHPPIINENEIRKLYIQLSEELKQSIKGKAVYAKYVDVSVGLGDVCADFEARTIDGSTVKLSDYKDSYILLNFTRVNCGWCKKFSQDLSESYDKIKDKVVVVFFYEESDEKSWVDHVKKSDFKWTVVSDLKGSYSPAVIKYNVTGIPRQFLIDKNGIIIKENSGYLPEFIDELEKLSSTIK